MQPSNGKLYLIPNTLGDTAPLEVLPISVKKIIESTSFFIVENEKIARRFIKKITPNKSQGDLTIFHLNKFTNPVEIETFLEPCFNGNNIGVISEAGCPGIADPGADIVKLAHNKAIQIVPLVGPSSILLALISSGLNGQNFAFNGYLPIDNSERKKYLKQLERLSFEKNQTQLFIETPYRNNSMLEAVCKWLHKDTLVCIACDITLPTEYIKTQSVEDWKHTSIDLHKRPALFLIQKT